VTGRLVAAALVALVGPALADGPQPARVPMGTGGSVARPEAPGAEAVRGRSGRVRWEARGCLAARGEAPARAFEVEPGRRALPEPPSVDAAPGGARVRHQLTHACCLAGAVRAVRARGVWEVRETLSGTPCRCLCASTLETFVSLPRGRQRVRVVVLRGEERTVAGEWTLDVR
jgi:hypothetical protein